MTLRRHETGHNVKERTITITDQALVAHLSSVPVLALATAASHAAGRRGVEPPPNAPAAIEWELEVFAIREARPHPWVLSTTRQISQGGVSLLDERWDGDGNVLKRACPIGLLLFVCSSSSGNYG